jgi:very-short-patch-repair endonuclease
MRTASERIKRMLRIAYGSQHFEQKDYDEKRKKYLESKNFKILRYWNNEVFQNMEGILAEIYQVLSQNPHPVPLPL